MAMDSNLHKLQEEAIHRVQEMQSRARQHLEDTRQAAEAEQAPAEPQAAQTTETLRQAPQEIQSTDAPVDTERMLLLLLALLLYQEGAQLELLFSLLSLIL